MNYFKIYCNLVNKRLQEPSLENIEKHHIIPKSVQDRQIVIDLFKDYEVGQLVNLTYREHYIVHELLVKIFEKLDKYSYFKMLKAWQRLANDKVHTSWDYSIFRERWIKDCNSGENNVAKRFEVRKKISIANKGKISYMRGITKSEETKNKISNTRKEKFKNGEISPYWKNKHLSEETKNKISNTRKEKFKNEKEFREKILKINKIINQNKIKNNNFKKVPIVQLSLDGKLIREYDYIKQVEKYNFSYSVIKKCINHLYVTKLGNNIYGKKEKFIWLRLNEYTNKKGDK